MFLLTKTRTYKNKTIRISVADYSITGLKVIVICHDTAVKAVNKLNDNHVLGTQDFTF